MEYPYKSPSLWFANRMFHPNVDEASGSVCLDVINQTWSPMFDLLNIFEVFLPQLLGYPNPADPLNGEAASLMLRDPDGYKIKIREHVKQHAQAGNCVSSDGDAGSGSSSAKGEGEDDDEDEDEVGDMSDLSELSDMDP